MVPCPGLLQRLFAGENIQSQPPARQIIPIEESGFAAIRKANLEAPAHGQASCFNGLPSIMRSFWPNDRAISRMLPAGTWAHELP
jgi:hypothetical protein